MLVHTECGGSIIIDQSRYGSAIGSDIWYGIKCNNCGAHLGMLPNVATVALRYERRILNLEEELRELWKTEKQSPS